MSTPNWKRFDTVVGSVRNHVVFETRDAEQVERLLAALEAFNDGTLGPVVRVGEGAELLARCSEQVEDVLGRDHAITVFLRKCGVRYIGEACYLVFDRRKPRLAAMEDAIRTEFGLPAGYDPIHHEWRPPYWDDMGFRHAIDMSTIDVFGEFRGSYVRGDPEDPRKRTFVRMLRHSDRAILRMGDMLKWLWRDCNVGDMRRAQTLLTAHARKAGLWAGAIVPQLWKSVGVPESWATEDAVIAAELETFLKPLAYVVEWSGTKARFFTVLHHEAMPNNSRWWVYPDDKHVVVDNRHRNPLIIDGNVVLLKMNAVNVLNGDEKVSARAFSREGDARSFITSQNLTLDE